MEKEWYMETGGISNKRFSRNIFIKPSEIKSAKERFNHKDCFISVYMYNDKDIKESDIYGPLYLDLDTDLKNEEDFKKIKTDLNIAVNTLNIIYKIDKKFIRIYFSGNKGFHIVIHPKVFGIKPCKRLNEYYKYIAEDINSYTVHKSVDLKIYDKRRLIRLADTMNSKTGLYKVPLTLEFVNKSNFEELKEYASEIKDLEFKEIETYSNTKKEYQDVIEKVHNGNERRKPRKIRINKSKKLPDVPCIRSIMENGVNDGCRNNTSVALASCLLQNGFDMNECESIMIEWDEAKNNPPMGEVEVMTTINSAYKFLLDDKIFGCGSLKSLDLCDAKNCRIAK